MIEFCYLRKSQFDQYAERLFEILNANMRTIAPTGNSYEEDFSLWYSAVANGLKRENRYIILVFERPTGRIIGFFQYYTNEQTFMMEEIQLAADYQGKDSVFRKLYGFVLEKIDKDITYVKAYADKKNNKSRGILGKLGLAEINENEVGTIIHFRGRYEDLLKWYAETA